MPRTAVTGTTTSRAGVDISAAAKPANVDVANGNQVSGNDGKTLHIHFRTGANADYLLVSQIAVDGVVGQRSLTGGTAASPTTQAANKDFLYGPFPTSIYGSLLLLNANQATSTIIPVFVGN